MSEELAPDRRMSKKQKKTLIVLTVIALSLIALIATALGIVFSRFKLKYAAFIRQYSAEYDLDPTFVAGVVYTESKFLERAESRVGARGLMQIMPETGAEIAAALNEPFDPENLFDAETSVRYGCYYLRRQLDRFDQNPAVALAAYNAGPNKAAQWLRQYGLDSQGRITYIPYPETSNYVKRVLGAQKIYSFLYSDQLNNKAED